jgi:uncharacterized protein (DUF934 family)
MRTILRGRNVAPDPWRHIGEDGWTDSSHVIVPLAGFLAEPATWFDRGGALGVRVAPSDDILALAPHLERIALVAIEFPGPGEGRGYSQAALLRERLGFTGEVRAIGAVKRDQLLLMARSGIDSFELSAGESPEAALAALAAIHVAYQGDRAPWLALERRSVA